MQRRSKMLAQLFDIDNPLYISNKYDLFMQMICSASKGEATHIVETLMGNTLTYEAWLALPDFNLEEFISALEEHTNIKPKMLFEVAFTYHLNESLRARAYAINIDSSIQAYNAYNKLHDNPQATVTAFLRFAEKSLEGITLSQIPLQVCLNFVENKIDEYSHLSSDNAKQACGLLNELKALLNSHGKKNKIVPTSTQLIYEAIYQKSINTDLAIDEMDEAEMLAASIALSLKLTEKNPTYPSTSPQNSDDKDTRMLTINLLCEDEAPTFRRS